MKSSVQVNGFSNMVSGTKRLQKSVPVLTRMKVLFVLGLWEGDGNSEKNRRQCKPNAMHKMKNKCKGRFKNLYFLQVSLYYSD